MSTLPTNVVLSRDSGWRVALRHIKGKILRRVTRSSVQMFLRPGDIISIDPMVAGVHEPHIVDFLRVCARNEYSHFLIDIGANIGLTSCPVAELFDEIFLFEPNPLAFSILSVNADCTGFGNKFDINNFGIGERDEQFFLMIPRNNWGGAFVQSPENIYSEKTLSGKDNFRSIDEQNYLRREVQIRSGEKVLSKILGELRAKGRTSGVIKIDVEGYELSVLSEIAKAFPADMEAYVVLENWEPSIAIEQFVRPFGPRASAFSFAAPPVVSRGAPKFIKALQFAVGLPFGRSNFDYRLREVGDPGQAVIGDIVLHISSSG